MIYSDETEEHLPEKEEHQMGSAVWERGVHGRCQRSMESERKEPL